MKLRLRSTESKETLRLEVPDPCSLHQLKQSLAQSISASPSSLRLSLNRRDDLHAPSPHDSLHSLGITSGDLIFYTLDPSSQTLTSSSPNESSNFPNSETLFAKGSVMGDSITEDQRSLGSNAETLVSSGAESMEPDPSSQTLASPSHSISHPPVQSPNQGSDYPNPETLVDSGAESMEIDDGFDETGWKKYSVPFFLRRVLREELGEDRSNHKLLVIAVHAVLLESGFVGVDSVSGIQANQFSYTLPEILRNRGNKGNGVEGVVLKFLKLGHLVKVYGRLANGGSGVFGVCLDENRFAPMINYVWENRNVNEGEGLVPEKEVFEFWKMVKDGITLPLLINLCTKAGLPAPASLMRLPSELKMKILELLPGVDIAKVGCVCRELRNVASYDELWKQKCAEEFGEGSGGEGTTINWKYRFARGWKTRQQQKKAVVRRRSFERLFYYRDSWEANPLFVPRIRRDPDPLFVPPIIGGDYDRFPVFGLVDPTGPPHPILQQPRMPGMRRNFSPNCNLGRFSG